MKISISESAKKQFMEDNNKNYRIFIKGYGWGGPVFGLAQGEPQEEDETYTIDNINFSVEKDISDLIPGFHIEYYKGIFQRGYVVYVDGASRSC